jgi:hypothetical protein
MGGGGAEAPERCRTEMPPLAEVAPGHATACWYPLTPGEELQAAAHA